MRTALLLTLAVLASVAQRADESPLRVRAGICKDRKCMERSQVAFAPARVSVQVYLGQHPGNRALAYGLQCDGVTVAESQAQVDGESDPPLFLREFVDVDAGDCLAVATLARADGSQHTARSERLLIQSRLGDPD